MQSLKKGDILIRTGVTGALGKMGKEVVKTIINDPELELACAIDKFETGEMSTGISL